MPDLYEVTTLGIGLAALWVILSGLPDDLQAEVSGTRSQTTGDTGGYTYEESYGGSSHQEQYGPERAYILRGGT